MHKDRDSRGRFIARGRSYISTTPPTPPRVRKDTPPSQTHTPNLRIPRIQGAPTQLEDSPTSFTKTDLGEKTSSTSTGEPIVVEEVGIPTKEEEAETLSHNPLIEELDDSEEAIMVEEEQDGEFSLFGGGG